MYKRQTVNYEQFAVTDPSEIGTYTFKIPQDEEELEISAEFPDGILYLTKVSRMEEKMKWGTDEDGKDLLLSLIHISHRVSFIWVKGHAGHPQNERCDMLATTAADGQDLLVDEGVEN